MPISMTETYRSKLGEFVAANNIDTVSVITCDLHGYARGKQITAQRFLEALDGPIHLSTLFTMLDCGNYPIKPPENSHQWWPGWEDGYSDSVAIVDPVTIRTVPWQPRTALVIAEFSATNPRNSLDFLPRNVVRNLVARYEALGYDPRIGAEIEAMIFRGDAYSAAEQGFRNLSPLWHGLQAYIVTSLGKNRKTVSKLIDGLRHFGVAVESWHPEAAPGQLEITLEPSSPLKSSDDCFLLKHAVKELAAEEECLASFMAKIFDDGFSSGCHLNFSLWRGDKNLFFSENDRHEHTVEFNRVVAGITETLPEFTLLFAPTPNSYRRFQAYQWTGMNAAWGHDNKSTSVRTVNESHQSARLEHRTAGADVNPYIAIAAVLAAGLHGLENQLKPQAPIRGDAYANASVSPLPQEMATALHLFRNSNVAKKYLGEDFVRFYALTREAELALFEKHAGAKSTESVTHWELERYLELI